MYTAGPLGSSAAETGAELFESCVQIISEQTRKEGSVRRRVREVEALLVSVTAAQDRRTQLTRGATAAKAQRRELAGPA